jgi:hypothetical protein
VRLGIDLHGNVASVPALHDELVVRRVYRDHAAQQFVDVAIFVSLRIGSAVIASGLNKLKQYRLTMLSECDPRASL